MRDRALSEKPRRLLVGGMRARKILLSSPYLKWLMKMGLKVTHLYQVIEYTPVRCFEKFVDQVSQARRSGDIDPDQAIIADTMKLIGNSGYGSLIMDKEKHQNVLYVQGTGNARLKINDPLFRKCTAVSADLYEMELAKAKIVLDLPIQLGYHILQLAKLRMLQFRFDFLEEFCGSAQFEYIEMDTDSAYMAIAGHRLEDIVRPHKRQELHHQKFRQCHDRPFTSAHGFFPRECCPKHIAYDKRTPGLFKVEAEGKAMIALCSKTYILKQPDDKVKFSSKGINKNALTNAFDVFHQVLTTQDPYSATNLGFRAKDNTIFTYQQQRAGISYFYCKREVLSDGIHTKPLDITLSPWSSRCLDIVHDTHPWNLSQSHHFEINGKSTVSSLADIIEKHHEEDDLIRHCLRQLPDYVPKGDILFPLPSSLKKIDFWKKDTYWTTGMSTKATPLRDIRPGQNKLGQFMDEISTERTLNDLLYDI
jgi:hypothetical protein